MSLFLSTSHRERHQSGRFARTTLISYRIWNTEKLTGVVTRKSVGRSRRVRPNVRTKEDRPARQYISFQLGKVREYTQVLATSFGPNTWFLTTIRVSEIADTPG